VVILNNGKVAFDQSMQDIAQKLSFGVARETFEYEQALYAEEKLKGSAIVSVNLSGAEGRVDLELLYKSVIFSNEAITSQFN
jgi:ABC-2 type transport system ATP-binding protein